MLNQICENSKMMELEKQNKELTNTVKLYASHLKVKSESLSELFNNILNAKVEISLLNEKITLLESEKETLKASLSEYTKPEVDAA